MYGHYMTGVHKRLSGQLETVTESKAKYCHMTRRSIDKFTKKELVMLNGKNIRWKERWMTLDDKMYGPFKILSTGHNDQYCKLKLPPSWKIPPTFNIALLERYRGKNPEREVIEMETDGAGWEMETVIGSGPSNEDATKHVFLVKWRGYSHEENTREMWDNVDQNARGLLEEYCAEIANMDKDKRFGKKWPRQKDDEGAGKRKSCKHRKSLVFTLL